MKIPNVLDSCRKFSRRLLLSLMFVAGVTSPLALDAAETDAIFNGTNGKLVLPYLRIGNDVYYVELNLVDPVNLLFQVSLTSINNITPTGGGSAPDRSAIIGTWSDTNYTLTLNGDGTYVFVTVHESDGCPPGAESGTYQWEPSTGVFVTTPVTDDNGKCGFSDVTGIQRVSLDGNQFRYSVNGVSSVLGSGFGSEGGNNGPVTRVLTIAKTGNGSGLITSSKQPGINCGDTCNLNVEDGTTVTLTATPTSGSYLFSWDGCPSVSGTNGTVCTLQVNSNKTVGAKFVSTLLTVSTAGPGSGNVVSSTAGINCGAFGSDCAYSFPIGTTASLQATPANGSIFQNWSGGCTSVTGPNGSICNVLISVGQSFNVTVTATFTKTPSITVGVVGSGSGNVTSSNPGINCGTSGSACSYVFPAGTTASLTALAASGSTFAGWSGGCTSITGNNGNICNIVISSSLSNNVTVDAAFVKNP